LGEEMQRLLRAADDHDLRRVAVHAAGGADVRGDGLAQRRLAGRIAVDQRLCVEAAGV